MSIQMLNERDPETVRNLYRYRSGVFKDGALSRKQKELIALALANSTKCEKCLDHHYEEAKNAGATGDEILEVMEVVMYMLGPSAIIWSERIDEIVK